MCIILIYSFHKCICNLTPYNQLDRTEKIDEEGKEKRMKEERKVARGSIIIAHLCVIIGGSCNLIKFYGFGEVSLIVPIYNRTFLASAPHSSVGI